jgi:hypothetical protein
MNYELATQSGLTVFLHTDDTDFTDAHLNFVESFVVHQTKLRS